MDLYTTIGRSPDFIKNALKKSMGHIFNFPENKKKNYL